MSAHDMSSAWRTEPEATTASATQTERVGARGGRGAPVSRYPASYGQSLLARRAQKLLMHGRREQTPSVNAQHPRRVPASQQVLAPRRPVSAPSLALHPPQPSKVRREVLRSHARVVVPRSRIMMSHHPGPRVPTPAAAVPSTIRRIIGRVVRMRRHSQQPLARERIVRKLIPSAMSRTRRRSNAPVRRPVRSTLLRVGLAPPSLWVQVL